MKTEVKRTIVNEMSEREAFSIQEYLYRSFRQKELTEPDGFFRVAKMLHDQLEEADTK